jgi:hypothetical protein
MMSSLGYIYIYIIMEGNNRIVTIELIVTTGCGNNEIYFGHYRITMIVETAAAYAIARRSLCP